MLTDFNEYFCWNLVLWIIVWFWMQMLLENWSGCIFFCGGWLKSRRVTVSRCRAWPYVSGFPWFKQHHVTRAIGNLSFWDQVLYVFQASFILPSKLLRMPPAGMAFCALGTAMQSLSESAAPWSSTTRPSPQMFRSPLSSHLTQCEQMLRAYRALVEPT